ncbi:hypothetical protein [Rhodococcus sp. GA1]|uniref:hypothetical protein n=1 Tax=Rhodococcus sp. GA1 TaxID=2942275 RepID=UPI0020CC242A|nr:hypothetical protein [Rhodococcus sp. GA1]
MAAAVASTILMGPAVAGAQPLEEEPANSVPLTTSLDDSGEHDPDTTAEGTETPTNYSDTETDSADGADNPTDEPAVPAVEDTAPVSEDGAGAGADTDPDPDAGENITPDPAQTATAGATPEETSDGAEDALPATDLAETDADTDANIDTADPAQSPAPAADETVMRAAFDAEPQAVTLAASEQTPGFVPTDDGVVYTNRTGRPIVVTYSIDASTSAEQIVAPGETVTLPTCENALESCRYDAAHHYENNGDLRFTESSLLINVGEIDRSAVPDSRTVTSVGYGYGAEFVPSDEGIEYTNRSAGVRTVAYTDGVGGWETRQVQPGETVTVPECDNSAGCHYSVIEGTWDGTGQPQTALVAELGISPGQTTYRTLDGGYGPGFTLGENDTVTYTNVEDREVIASYWDPHHNSAKAVTLRPGESVVFPTCAGTDNTCHYQIQAVDPETATHTTLHSIRVVHGSAHVDEGNPTDPTEPTTPVSPSPTNPGTPTPGTGTGDKPWWQRPGEGGLEPNFWDYAGTIPGQAGWFSQGVGMGLGIGNLVNATNWRDRMDAIADVTSGAISFIPGPTAYLGSAALDVWSYNARQFQQIDWSRDGASTVSYALRNPRVVAEETAKAVAKVAISLLPSFLRW